MSIEERRKQLESTIDCLIWDISSTIQELDENFNDLSNLGHSEKYVNIDNVIQKMKKDNIYTPEIENFFEEYLKFYND